jgi:hypothetical protein
MPTPIRPLLLGLTVGLALGTVLGTATVSRGTAGRADATLEARVAALEALTRPMTLVDGPLEGLAGPHLLIQGVNVHIRSGSGVTDDFDPAPPTGLGNLIIGYNEAPDDLAPGDRGGSHILVVGPDHRYRSTAGLLAGTDNTLSGANTSVTGGRGNTAGGFAASVSGGQSNTASGDRSTVTGGFQNTASGNVSSVGGGVNNHADGVQVVIGGGSSLTASTTSCWIAGTSATFNDGC